MKESQRHGLYVARKAKFNGTPLFSSENAHAQGMVKELTEVLPHGEKFEYNMDFA